MLSIKSRCFTLSIYSKQSTLTNHRLREDVYVHTLHLADKFLNCYFNKTENAEASMRFITKKTLVNFLVDFSNINIIRNTNYHTYIINALQRPYIVSNRGTKKKNLPGQSLYCSCLESYSNILHSTFDTLQLSCTMPAKFLSCFQSSLNAFWYEMLLNIRHGSGFHNLWQ